MCFHFSSVTFLGVEFLGFGVDICFTWLKIMPIFRRASPAGLFSSPSITINWLMLCARRNKESEWSVLVSVASLSIARFPKTILCSQMPLSGSCSGGTLCLGQPWAGLSPDWWERDVATHWGAQQAELVAERGSLLSGGLFCLQALQDPELLPFWVQESPLINTSMSSRFYCTDEDRPRDMKYV